MTTWCRLVLAAVLISSCREIEPVSPPQPFSGYRLDGIVTTTNGFPLEGVEIRLFYLYGGLHAARDTARVFIADTVTSVQIVVHDPEGNIVTRFSLPSQSRYLSRKVWDEKDSTGSDVKNGLHMIRIYFNGFLAIQYEWLVDERISAVTNANGLFVLPPPRLPIGSIIDLYDSLGAYDETSDITGDVALRLRSLTAQRTVVVTLDKNRITRVSITM